MQREVVSGCTIRMFEANVLQSLWKKHALMTLYIVASPELLTRCSLQWRAHQT